MKTAVRANVAESKIKNQVFSGSANLITTASNELYVAHS